MPDQTQQPTPAPELTIIDLQNLRSMIEVASRRGAFQAAEMSAVGGVFNKLNAFITSVAPPETAPAPADPASAI